MKVRTLNELQDKLDNDIQWRKKELTDYKLVLEKNKESTAVIPLIRGGITLSYAHWEGFIKNSSSFYISYISTLNLPLDKVKLNFVALKFKKKLNLSNGIIESMNLIEEIQNIEKLFCKIFDKDIIDTKSNLKFKILNEIIVGLGFEIEHFERNENFIDKKLVEPRNDIAHGTYRDVNYDDYKIVFENVIPLMEYYKTLIENSASLKSYLK
ncbi:MAE_28990/MAE_18760 family HEPN-like nuclease [Chryseobacterium sp. GMJ5]|uniref:MAE_28990/MAE_18760 family HEPN-like nuclease n=1 Tax=Chryseobacterium gilvum TaxID=2976534 RepID=A0ABT2VUA5_9FLAO|nr:MAE_28990/MAE_18760 family HEPN-like nuclease [Chryseobacterium gilvum]MCU7613335.1 MAE_28990/MAE_18760 family HEPN-like nuclease [Chryseobacterium gilvum]